MKPIIFASVIISRILWLFSGLFFDIETLFYTHPLTGQKVLLVGFIWHIGNFFPIIALGFLSIFGDNTWTITSVLFTILSFVDYVDFLLEGNNVWWTNGIFPVSMNTLTGFIFALSCMYEFIVYGKHGYTWSKL